MSENKLIIQLFTNFQTGIRWYDSEIGYCNGV